MVEQGNNGVPAQQTGPKCAKFSRRTGMRKGLVMVVAGLAAGIGCASYQTTGSPRAALPLPPELADYYRCPTNPVAPVVQTVERHADYWVKDVTLFEEGAEPIKIVWYLPTGHGPQPLIMVSPIRGSDTLVVDDCARMFASCGYQAA